MSSDTQAVVSSLSQLVEQQRSLFLRILQLREETSTDILNAMGLRAMGAAVDSAQAALFALTYSHAVFLEWLNRPGVSAESPRLELSPGSAQVLALVDQEVTAALASLPSHDAILNADAMELFEVAKAIGNTRVALESVRQVVEAQGVRRG